MVEQIYFLGFSLEFVGINLKYETLNTKSE